MFGGGGFRFPLAGPSLLWIIFGRITAVPRFREGGLLSPLAGPSLFWIVLEKILSMPTLRGGRAPISLGRAIISLDHVGENHNTANALGGAGSTPHWQGYDFLYRL